MKTTDSTTVKFTRADYMEKKCTHRQYYAQFVIPAIASRVSARIGVEVLRNSKDEHLNDIPLGKWDNLFDGAPLGVSAKMREAGDFPTMAGLVCIAKEAARQIIEAQPVAA